jgi:putative oxidoreductase
MRDAALLGARFLLGGYMGIHASQKLLGKFHGPGLDAISGVFEDNGLSPGREMAMAAAATEIAGGVLTITGIADPVGPLAVAGAMAVAAGFNRERGLMAQRNGVELPVVYATLALTLAATGAGKYKIGPSIPGRLAAVGALVGGVAAGALITRMVTSKPAAAEPAQAGAAAEPPAEA